MRKCSSFLLALPLVLVMSGCSSKFTQSGSIDGPADSTPSSSPVEDRLVQSVPDDSGRPRYRSFKGDTLYDLLVAEVARRRGRMDIALGNYLRQAHETGDSHVAEQATILAQQQNAHRAKLNAATIWASAEPENPSPRQVIAIEKMRQGDYDGAAEQLDILLSMKSSQTFEPLVNGAASLNQEQREGVLTALYGLQKKHPKNPHIWVTIAILEDQNNQLERSLKAIDEALDLASSKVELTVLKVKLLINHQRFEDAEQLLARTTRKYPDSQYLLLMYAQILTEQNKLAQAEEQFAKLLQARPDDPKLLLSLGLLAYENNHFDQAKVYLLRLLELDQLVDDASLHLGRILAQEGDIEGALNYYRRIGFGPNYLNARVQMAVLLSQQDRLNDARVLLQVTREEVPEMAPVLYRVETEFLVRAGQPKEALRIIDSAVASSPADPELLFSRAMIYEGLDQIDAMEKDLRMVLKHDPQNFSAMNALGYTLADRNMNATHLEEAKQLVQRALELAPNEPAILDSMGWVYYRLGDQKTALSFLRRAHSLLPDPEVAAHLGEVLWMSGDRQAAERIWSDALKLDPGNELVVDTRKRVTGIQVPVP